MLRTTRYASRQRGALITRLALTVTLCVLFAACGSGRTATPTSSTDSHDPAASSSSGAISITNFAFTPATLTITVGGTVTWTNNAPLIAHTVTSDDGSPVSFDHTLAPNDTFTFQFTQAGAYHYHCNIHPFMHGAIVVSPATTTPSAMPTATLGPTTTVTLTPTPGYQLPGN